MRRRDRHPARGRQHIGPPLIERTEPVHLKLPPIDDRVQILRLQQPGIQRVTNGPRHLMPAAGAVQHLPPPLPAHHGHHRLAHQVARAGDLVIECIERQQRLPPEWRRKERG